jgi:hypothetical protein
MGYEERAERLARLQRYMTEHPGELVGFDSGDNVYCPGRRVINDRRAPFRQGPSERRAAPRTRPCGYQWGRAGPDTTVYAQMIRGDLGKRPTDPSFGPPPPIRAPSAFFKCPECQCSIEFLYFYMAPE